VLFERRRHKPVARNCLPVQVSQVGDQLAGSRRVSVLTNDQAYSVALFAKGPGSQER
jgi:hypothetical protein